MQFEVVELTPKEIIECVEDWAAEKNLLRPENSFQQLAKTMEELGEIASALCKKKPVAELADGIGDVAVTLIILAAQNGLRFEDCLAAAWDEIANRTGKTVNGVFIKD
jgi:NTP pyrophosphatase (non-canonical NTP hydrolase)